MKRFFCLILAALVLLLTACTGGVTPETESPTAPATLPSTAPETVPETAPETNPAPSVGALHIGLREESLTVGEEYTFMVTASKLPIDEYMNWGIVVSSGDEAVLEVLSWENLGYGEDMDGDGFITCQAEVRVLEAGTAKIVARIKAANLETVKEIPAVE